MANKEWLLNPSAIQKAKECIQLIQQHLGVRLRLTHPNFLEMISDYAEMTDSRDLQLAYTQLARMAGVEVDILEDEPTAKVVNMPFVGNFNSEPEAPQNSSTNQNTAEREVAGENDYIHYHGKDYPRFNADGKEFKGLYRGQARYG